MKPAIRIEAIVENEVAATLELSSEHILDLPDAIQASRLELFRACVAGMLMLPNSNVTLRVCGEGFDYHF